MRYYRRHRSEARVIAVTADSRTRIQPWQAVAAGLLASIAVYVMAVIFG